MSGNRTDWHLIQVSNLRPGFWWQNMALSSKSHNMHTHLSQFGLILDLHTTLAHTEPWIYILTAFLFTSIQYISCVLKPVLLSSICYGTQKELLSKLSRQGFQWKNNKFQSIAHTKLSYGFKKLGIWHDTFMMLLLLSFLFFGAFHCMTDRN